MLILPIYDNLNISISLLEYDSLLTYYIMKNISTISSLLLIGTTFGILVRGWLTPVDLNIDLTDDEVHLYL